MAALRLWIRLGRPHFLVGGFAFYGLGVLYAVHAGAAVSLVEFVIGQAFVTAAQLGVHFGNEWYDLEADRANETRTLLAGGSHVLADNLLAPSIALTSSRVAFVIAGFLGLAIGALAGINAALVAMAILVLSWSYSAPPLKLHSRGIGGLAAGFVVAGLVPALAVTIAHTPIDATSIILGAPLVLHVAALVGVLSLPDVAGDSAAGKRTLSVRLGTKRAGRIIQAGWILAGLITLVSIAATRAEYMALAAGAALTLAVAFPMLSATRRWNALALAAVALVSLQWLLTGMAIL